MSQDNKPEVLPTAESVKAALPQENLTDLLKALQPYAEPFQKAMRTSGWQDIVRLAIISFGGGGVLVLAFYAGYKDHWDFAEKLAIPVLTFFAGLMVGKSKG